MVRRLALLMLLSFVVGCEQKEEVAQTPESPALDVKSMSKELQASTLAKAQAEHDVASKVFSDLNALRFDIQTEIGKAKEAGFSGASALVELRRLLKAVDVELASVQDVTIDSMKIIRQLQKIESAPMITPRN
jgi:hypothetical protein